MYDVKVVLRVEDCLGNSSRYHYLAIDKFTTQLAIVLFSVGLAMLD